MKVIEEEKLLKKLDDDGGASKQVFACLTVGLLHVIVGFGTSFSSIIVPQLLHERSTSIIEVSSTETSWIVSANAMGMLLSSLLSGLVADRFGRLNTMKFMSGQCIVGWFLVGTAHTADYIVVGQVIVGFSLGFLINSVYVYIEEVSSSNFRGLMLSSTTLYVSMGLLLMYIQGRYLHWRWIAWVVIMYTFTVTALLFLIPESPPWLVSKNQIEEATKSLNWFSDDSAGVKIQELTIENAAKVQKQKEVSLRTFAQPSVCKPFFVLAGLFTLQQFSGVDVITSNSIIFFMKMGVTYDLYLVAILTGVIRIITSGASLWLLKVSDRRALLCVSGLGVAASLSLSALTTKWMQEDECEMWLPVVLIMACFFFADFGLSSIPFVIAAELFPLNVRGAMRSLSTCVCCAMSFASLHYFNSTLEILGGAVGLQYFYANVSLALVVYTFVFVPETHKKKLEEVGEHFRRHCTYL